MSLLISTVRRSGGALAPVFTSSPAISGTYSIGSVLTCAPGAWTGTAPVTPSYQWLRDGVAIGGATASTYTVVSADMLATVTCVVTITNSAGSDVDTSNGLSWADYVAPLAARTWLDAHGGTYLTLSGGTNIDAALDRTGSGNHGAEVGSRRPTYDAAAFGGRGGMLFTAANSSRLTTPAFAMGGRSSGSIIWRPTGAPQSPMEFGNVNTHTQLVYTSGQVFVRRVPSGSNATLVVAVPSVVRCTWAMDTTRFRALINGTEIVIGAGVLPGATSELTIGAADRGALWPLDGHIGELIFADAVWSDATMNAVDAASAARWT